MKYTIITLALLLTSSLSAQEMNSFKQQEIGVSIGIRSWNIQEQRYSNRTKQTSVLNFGIHHEKVTDASRTYFSAKFGINFRPKKGEGLRYGVLNPDVSFSYQRKANNTWIGPYLSHQTLLTQASNTRGLFNNNPVSYTMLSSLGLAVDQTFDISDSNFELTAGGRVALLNHSIRPSYAHPYPDEFLVEGVFDPTREGMAPAILRSGKIRSVDKVQNFRVRFGISYSISNSFKLGLAYEAQILSTKEEKSIRAYSNDISLRISHTY